ncbi:hypothetical protein EBR25_02730 [bacterium]|nr:hypothetical protein [bacterium]
MTKGWPRISELFVSLFVAAIACLLLVPLPTAVLDILLALNLASAFFLLLVVLYLPNAVQLLAFPTILLLTTLFRLGLNVASTRLILSQGDAGQVIESFGTFLVGGELLVGVVVFAIITVINLMVIAKGASRISEVAARFALDSLPGKQMSIDADLRAGLISPQEAERRREQLRKESQLYGAMDGAMKFVQGDAIAGVVIIFTNVVGGLSLGLYHGMGLENAVSVYTTLTVGDGLVSQIPAFLIAISAGLVVTRIGTSSESTIGTELRHQLFRQPIVLIVVSVLLFGLSAIDGMPWQPFVIVGTLSLVSWFAMRKMRDLSLSREGTSVDGTLIGEEGSVLQLPLHDTFVLSVSSEIGAVGSQRIDSLTTQAWKSMSQESYFYFGAHLPAPRIELDKSLRGGEYELRRGQQVLIHHAIPEKGQFVAIHPIHAKALGFVVLKEEVTPLFGGAGSWIRVHTPGVQRMVDALEVRSFNPLEFMALQLFEFCRRNPEEVITMRWLHAELKDLENAQPGLVSEALEDYGISVSRLLSVIHQLLREGLPILHLQRLVEDVSTFYSSANSASEVDEQFNMVELVVFLRHRHRERLMGFQKKGRAPMRIIRITPGVESLFLSAGGQLLGGSLQMSRSDYRNLRETLENILQTARMRGVLPIAIQCPSFLRVPVFHFLHSLAFTVPMLCDDEISLECPRVVFHEWSIGSDS